MEYINSHRNFNKGNPTKKYSPYSYEDKSLKKENLNFNLYNISPQKNPNSRLVNIWNKNRESLYYKNDFRERRFQDGRIRNELMKLDKVSTAKEQRGNTVDTKMNTYPHQNYLLNPKNKKNIFNYIDNLNFV